MKKTIIIILTVISTCTSAMCATFEDFFWDSTLRIDMTFAGNAESQSIYLDELAKLPKWNGRRVNLTNFSVQGNGQIEVRDHKSQELIFVNSFSTLFQEWVTYPEAQTTSRSFQSVILVPMPKNDIDVRVSLLDNRHETKASATFTIDPKDILIRPKGDKPYATKEINKASDSNRCINIAIIGDGYTAEQMDDFVLSAQEATEAIFSHTPFKENRSLFNVVAVLAPSQESGPSIPRKGVWRNTLLSSHFDTFYSDRYLTTLDLKTTHDALAGTPYDHIIILVNTHEYGGGGILNFYNLSMTKNQQFVPVVTHEFGHSFAGLADEYAYDFEELDIHPLDIEPWEANITTNVGSNNKWSDVEGAKMIEGAGYRTKGIFRPFKTCRMRDNNCAHFCPVCVRAIQKVIDWHIKEIESSNTF